jgi:putative addiction module killer protein
MYRIRQTATFEKWLTRLPDRSAKARIEMRLRRAELGNLGDVRPVGSGVREMRIDHGPGYRLYYIQQGDVLIVMLCGGDKGSQQRDIRAALDIAAALGDD